MFPYTLKHTYPLLDTGAITALGIVWPPAKFKFDEFGATVESDSHGYTVTNPYPPASKPFTAVTFNETAPIPDDGKPVAPPSVVVAPNTLTRFTDTFDDDVEPKRPPPRVSTTRFGSLNEINELCAAELTVIDLLAPAPLVNPKSDKVCPPKEVELGKTTDVVITPLESAWSEFRTVGVDCRVITTHSNGVNPENDKLILSPGAGELLVITNDSGND